MQMTKSRPGERGTGHSQDWSPSPKIPSLLFSHGLAEFLQVGRRREPETGWNRGRELSGPPRQLRHLFTGPHRSKLWTLFRKELESSFLKVHSLEDLR